MSVATLSLGAEYGERHPIIRPLVTVSAGDWDGRPIPERRWLVKDLIPEHVVTMLSGDGGVGKSLLALQLAAAVAGGFDWIGTLPDPGGVLYLSAEDELDEHHRRLSAILKARSLGFKTIADLHIASLAGEDAILAAPEGRSGNLAKTPLWHGLEERIAAIRPVLTILDNSADVFGGNEISRPEVRHFVRILTGAAIRHSTTFLLLSHPSLAGMASGSGLSGSTAWNGSVRARLYLDRPKEDDADPDERLLKSKKSNYGPMGADTKLVWRAGAFEPQGGGPTGYSRAAAEAGAERMFLTLLARLTAQGRDVSHKPSPSYAPAIFAAEPDNGGTQKKAFSRALASLLQAGAVRIETSGPKSRERSRIVAA